MSNAYVVERITSMAKTKRSKKRSKKTRSKSSQSHRIDASLLLAVLDELNELAGLLRCVPELNILSDSLRGREWGREMGENKADEEAGQIDPDQDRIATAAMEHFGRNIDVIAQEERDIGLIERVRDQHDVSFRAVTDTPEDVGKTYNGALGMATDRGFDERGMRLCSVNWQLCEERIDDDSAFADDATVGSLVRDLVNEHTNWFRRA